jgi:WhiB family redox-sensing transcriptional regulator
VTEPYVPTWRDVALCRQVDPERFFPEKGESVKAAKRVCAACPVTTACLDYAMRRPAGQDFGIWGGLSERERKALRKQACKPATVTPLPTPVVATDAQRRAAA